MVASTDPYAGDGRALKNFREREDATREILEVISRSRDDEKPVFDTILRSALRLCEVDMSVLAMLNEEGTHLELTASAGAQFVALKPGEDRWPVDSNLTVARAVRERRNIVTEDLRDDDVYRQGNPTRVALVEKEGMRSQLVIPLMSGERAIGSFVLQRRKKRSFTQNEITLLQSFAAQAVIAIENVRQFKALERLNEELSDRVEQQVSQIERMSRLKRFLPAAVADTIVSQGSDKVLSSHRALLGVLFCDIRGFTAFCETAEPEETIEVLQTYHEEMGKLINAYGAGVDHRMGDGIMVLFNDPLPCDDPASDAVRLAIAMRERMAELSAQWKRLGYRLGFGVGISLGYATVGMVGFEGRFDYTASGTAINLAARLCDEAEDGEILLSPRAGIAVEDAYRLESRGEISLKGIREPLEVFRLGGTAAT
ncbi:adenylate/guanylate cyclase domain-containing protein [Stappia sediminis]|uniref:adenylate/guanylate cyclase domain-containing protein n=1 Tax=Stappia sediminis TaxID=2692190 RepID=UPI00136C03F9|nr:adenylate/guanylate cyclase domain-containing protein [Stappia sediminis]